MQLKINNLKYLIKPVYRTVLVSIFMTGTISAQEIIEENKKTYFEQVGKIIDIENSQLEIESFRKIKIVVELAILHIKFLKKFKTY